MTDETMTDPTEQPTKRERALALLREPFPPNQVSMLPKQMKRDDREKYPCRANHPDFRKASADGKECGGYHARSMHLDYVGHAALTDRLLDADPEWAWQPLATDDRGLPAFDQNGGLWIVLTVAGVQRLGYGDSQGKTGPNAIKEAIGDALRNAGMRFGAALDLWHKGDLHDAAEQQGQAEQPEERPNQSRAIEDAAQASAEQIVQANEWINRSLAVHTAEQVLEVYQQARKAGVLAVATMIDGKPTTVRDFIRDRGKALKQAEADARPESIRPDVLAPSDDEPSWASGGYTEGDLV